MSDGFSKVIKCSPVHNATESLVVELCSYDRDHHMNICINTEKRNYTTSLTPEDAKLLRDLLIEAYPVKVTDKIEDWMVEGTIHTNGPTVVTFNDGLTITTENGLDIAYGN